MYQPSLDRDINNNNNNNNNKIERLASIRIRRIPPIFPIHNWNMHQVTLAGEARTNNISEGWNNKFFCFVGHQHSSI
ncbi:hypothetical protein E2C01_090128 [Portunus trituberculatus]|uniref:Uncharacterized protein n=1 Tax=Portunus trituberculatus TaxID=210409 RepID=A0A5B7JL14_PORTR|nr:hypothetical protein [Portunus trituberculatus]